MDRHFSPEHDDVVLYEAPTGVARLSPTATAPTKPSRPDLVLYVVSLFGVYNQRGERIDGDALLVRAPNEPERSVLSAALGCTEEQLPKLLDQGGTWAVRQIHSIDGHRLFFEPC